jgi:glycerol-3-phosphate dehydrogenase
MYDVAVIWRGRNRLRVRKALARYDLRIVVLEGGYDIAMGSSRQTARLSTRGTDCKPGNLMAKLNVRGNVLFDSCALSLSTLQHAAACSAFDKSKSPSFRCCTIRR